MNAVVGVERLRPVPGVHEVGLLAPDGRDQGPAHRGRGVRARPGRFDEPQPPVGDERGGGTGRREDDHLVAVDVARRRREVDGIDLAAADLEVVREDQDLHRVYVLRFSAAADGDVRAGAMRSSLRTIGARSRKLSDPTLRVDNLHDSA
jgi:hypothetical protein